MENQQPQWRINPQNQTIICQGQWTILNLSQAFELQLLNTSFVTIQAIDLQNISQMDMAGAMLFLKLQKKIPAIKFLQTNEQKKLFALVQAYPLPAENVLAKPSANLMIRLGKSTYHGYVEFLIYLAFVGEVFCYIGKWLLKPQRILYRNIAKVIETTGYFGTPIIGLLSFLVGIVLAYQMGVQLENYGANIFVVNLLGISILREFAPLMTAIIVAGRTGSAFTAELGTMKVNLELDALTTMGVKPIEYLVTPKVLGLLIAMPLLSMWASFMGLMGGVIMAKFMLGITFQTFWHQFQEAIAVKQLWIGLIKTPVFAFIVASVGCFQGFEVELGAASVGQRTTRSVVQSLFLIIVADAVFSIVLSYFHA